MKFDWMRRAGLGLAAVGCLVLSGCGAGSVYSSLQPARFVVFGDAMSDTGQNGSRYTVNDGTSNIWVQQLATSYAVATPTPSSGGGLNYAMANARVVASPDAAGNAATLTLKQQIDSFLAGKSFAANDVVLLNGGTGDLIAQMNAVTAGTQTPAQMLTNATQAGADLASQVRRLVGAGAKFVVVTGAYNMGNSPWAASIGQNSQLTSAAINFNTGLLTNIVDLGANVLYVDMSYYMNLIVNQSPTYLGSGANASTPACTSVDAGAGIGIGTGKVNANLCNVNTIAAGVDYTVYAFADPVYFGPKAQRAFGDYAYSKMKIRW